MKTTALVLLLGLALMGGQTVAAPAAAARNTPQGDNLSQRGQERIAREVRHEILLLPYYGVFDSLSYKVNPDGSVLLVGEVVNPTLKSDAGNVVKRIEGVTHVDNQIQVLPLSPMDDRIRHAAFRAIYGSPQLTKYSWAAVQSIHIIVNNGHITLEGTVDNAGDKNVAELRAKSVPGAFSVTNNLVVGGKQVETF